MKDLKSIITDDLNHCLIEEWRDIKGYEGLYSVSNLGRVKSYHKTRGFCKVGRPINLTDNGYGYLIVSLFKDGKRKNHYVHRLVALAFIDNPENKPEVNHKDFNRKNNRVDNLEWSTDKENTQYSICNMKHPRVLKTKNIRSPYGTGIKFRKYSYEVYVCHKYIGRRKTLEEAKKLRDEYTKEHYNYQYEY